MKFFVDTADVAEIKELAATGLLDGVTTNPSLVAKTGRGVIIEDDVELGSCVCVDRAKFGATIIVAGNIPGRTGEWENTYCPGCGELLVERLGYLVRDSRESNRWPVISNE